MNTVCVIVLTAVFFCGVDEFVAWNLREKDIKIDRTRQCDMDKSPPIVIEEFTIYQPGKKQYRINATLNVVEDIDSQSNIMFRMFVSRCSLSMMHCEDIESTAVLNICDKFSQRGMLWTPVFQQLEPPFKCPLRKGTHRVVDGAFDLSLMRRLPIDPEKLNVNLTLYEYVPDEPNHRNVIKRQLICLEVKVTITLARNSNVTMLRPPMSRRNGTKSKN